MSFALASCFAGKSDVKATVTKEGTTVVIRITDAENNSTLLHAMEYLRGEGELSFAVDASGMVTSVEGVENAADWSACWMLYTSDAEMANGEWGTVTVDGVEYGSAILGASQLLVSVGETYIWSYQSF